MAKIRFDSFTGRNMGRRGAQASSWSRAPSCDTHNAWEAHKAHCAEKRRQARLALIAAIAKKT